MANSEELGWGSLAVFTTILGVMIGYMVGEIQGEVKGKLHALEQIIENPDKIQEAVKVLNVTKEDSE